MIFDSHQKRRISIATLLLSASRAATRSHSTREPRTSRRLTAPSFRSRKSGRRPSDSMTQQQPVLSPIQLRVRAFLNSLRYFFSWHFRPFIYGLLLLMVSLPYSVARLYAQVLKRLFLFVWPILRYILIRLVVALVFLILGSKLLGLIF